MIAEAGSNWRVGTPKADLTMAKRLVEVAREANCDAVKFQAFGASKVYAEGAGMPSYLPAHTKETRSINEIFDDCGLSQELIAEIAAYCAAVGIEFMASVFSCEDLAIVDPHVKRHKIASYELGYEQLVNATAKIKKPLILSTGGATLEEVTEAIRWTEGCCNLTLMHCVAAYPAEPSQSNLRAISHLLDGLTGADLLRPGLTTVRTGWSDHIHPVFGARAAIAAVALGASTIEKHFTISRSLPGPDHPFALEPDELVRYTREARGASEMMGDGKKRPMPCELELRRFATRACQALRNIDAGEMLSVGENVDALRPGNRKRGFDAFYLTSLEGRVLRNAVAKGDGITESDLETSHWLEASDS